MSKPPPLVCLLIPAFFLAPEVSGQPSPAGSDEADLLHARITLEDLLAFDPSDPFVGEGVIDRDFAHSTLPSRRSGVMIGLAGAWEEGQKANEWTGPALRAILRIDQKIVPATDFGCTAEKDAGERWDLGFRSAYLAVRDLPLGGECILGDYRIQSGCGLVLGTRAAPAGVEDAIRQTEARSELVPHRSRAEFGFLRGIAFRCSLLVPALSHVLVFFSRQSLPASGDANAPALSTNSLFRTETEIRGKDRIRETTTGGRYSMELAEKISCGLTILHTRFEPGLRGGVSGQPEGRCSTVMGLDISARSGPFCLKGELACSPGGRLAVVFLGGAAIGRSATLSLAVQSLSTQFASHRFESIVTAAASNENSFRISARCRLAPATHIEGILRQRWTPSIPPNRLSRSDGWNGGIGGAIGLGHGWELRWLYRVRRGDDESSVPLQQGGSQRRRVFTGAEATRISLHFHLAKATECRTTVQAVRAVEGGGSESERGEHLRQEVTWRPMPWLGISITGTMFSAEAYPARTSSLEDDAISRMRYESLDGDGFRWAFALTLAPPRTGLKVLALLARSELLQFSRPGSSLRKTDWGVRLQWEG